MRRFSPRALGLVLALFVAALGWSARGQDASTGLTPEIVKKKPEPTVTFARTWDAAVEEAKLLNVPIVVHSHGFY